MTREEERENQINAAAAMYVELLGNIPERALLSAVSIAHGLDDEQAMRLANRLDRNRLQVNE